MLGRKEIQIQLPDLLSCLSDIIDLVNPELVDHHKRVAYVAYRLGREMGLSEELCGNLLLAGKLHDIGALSLSERLQALEFGTTVGQRHAEAGYLLLRDFLPLAPVAAIIRLHHTRYDSSPPKAEEPHDIWLSGQILHLADRIVVLATGKDDLLGSAEQIIRTIEMDAGKRFLPAGVTAFSRLAKREYFWLDLASPGLPLLLKRKVGLAALTLDLGGLWKLTRIFARIIDFRSRFTATHSHGVATCARALAQLSGWCERECRLIEIAGFLHDLGKLGISSELLEKAGPLTPAERNIVRRHPFYTYRTLERIPELSIITAWSALHHECPDGDGYPFRIDGRDLPLGARIMAVADVFTALTEDRPYRPGLTVNQTLEILKKMAATAALDAPLVDLLEKHLSWINGLRRNAQAASTLEYQQLQGEIAEVA